MESRLGGWGRARRVGENGSDHWCLRRIPKRLSPSVAKNGVGWALLPVVFLAESPKGRSMVEFSVRETSNTTDNVVFTMAFDGQECPSYSSDQPRPPIDLSLTDH